MIIPFDIWALMIVLAGLCTAHSWFVRDKNNYTEAITGVIAVVLWLSSGISLLIGVKDEDMVFVSGWMMWLFVVFGIIEAIIVIVRIMDIINERKEDRQTTIKSVRL